MMHSIPLPDNFDGEKFSTKYQLGAFDFYVESGMIYSPIENPDLSDCIIVRETKLSPSHQIILANGEDIALVTITGEPGATVECMVNGQALSLTLDAAGIDTIQLDCDTPNTTLLVQAGTARAVVYAVEVPS